MKFLFSIALIFAFVFNSFSVLAMPLVYKINKQVEAGGEIFKFDTKTYKKILLGVGTDSSVLDLSFRVFAVSEGDSYFLTSFYIASPLKARAVPLENFSKEISLTADKAGNYKVKIWAE